MTAGMGIFLTKEKGNDFQKYFQQLKPIVEVQQEIFCFNFGKTDNSLIWTVLCNLF